MSMISSRNVSGVSSNAQCLIAPQNSISMKMYSSMSMSTSASLVSNTSYYATSLLKEKEENMYGSAFSKLAYHKSIEEVSTMIRLYNNSPANDHEALFSLLTQEKYRQLAGDLYNLKITKERRNYYETGYEKIRTNIILSFEALLYSMYQTKVAAANKRTYEGFKKDSEILHDTDKLKTYIENLTVTTHMLPEVVVSAPLMTIKPEYSLYMEKYGVPENGIWKPDLLAEMVEIVKKRKMKHVGSGSGSFIGKDAKRVSVSSSLPRQNRIKGSSNINSSKNPLLLSDQMERINALKGSEDTKVNFLGDDGMGMPEANNIYMRVIGTTKTVSSDTVLSNEEQDSRATYTPSRMTREERRRNPLQQYPIGRREEEERNARKVEEEEKDVDIFQENEAAYSSSKSIDSKLTPAPIPWEKWDASIPLAYWKALLR